MLLWNLRSFFRGNDPGVDPGIAYEPWSAPTTSAPVVDEPHWILVTFASNPVRSLFNRLLFSPENNAIPKSPFPLISFPKSNILP